MLILIFENIRGEAIDRLGGEYQVTREENELRRAHAVIVRNKTCVDSAFLDKVKELKVVGRAGVGLDNIDVDECERRGVVVVNTPGANTNGVAELVFAMLLSLLRKIHEAQLSVRAGKWERELMTGFELMGKTMGVVGLGSIGQRVCEIARGYRMKVVGYDPFVRDSYIDLLSLEELLRDSDFVSLHIPLNPETRHFMNGGRFSLMKEGSVFINTSRGEVVDEISLVKVLRDGRLAGACLDVRESEPPVIDELEKMPGVILTPHVGAFTVESQERTLEMVTADIVAVLSGKKPEHQCCFQRRHSTF